MTAKSTSHDHDSQEIPTISEESNALGDIKINHSVVASIVRLASLEVEGTYSVGSGGFVDGLTDMIKGKESDRGVRVGENEAGEYEIEVRVILRFGVELAKTALQIQQNVRSQVARMTMKPVSRVDVVIEGVRMDEDPEEDLEDWSEPHTD
jgi:uncharacterized alkaline shock family protein YloU